MHFVFMYFGEGRGVVCGWIESVFGNQVRRVCLDEGEDFVIGCTIQFSL